MPFPRFYTPEALFVVGEKTYLTQKARHHAGRALRLAAGEKVILFNGLGKCATGPITFEGDKAYINVERVDSPATDSPLHITLVQAIVSNEKIDFIVEKAVEIGVSALVLVPTERSITKIPAQKAEKKLTHWRDIMISACEQSGKNTLPTLQVMTFEAALTSIRAEKKFILAPATTQTLQLRGLTSVAFAVGPEGGFSENEIEKALHCGWNAAQMGPRILRTETAGLVAATLANAATGDLRLG